jgi:hypothetical protein
MPGDYAIGALYGDDFSDNQMRARSLMAKLDRLVLAKFEMNRRFHDPSGPDESRWQGAEADFSAFADR